MASPLFAAAGRNNIQEAWRVVSAHLFMVLVQSYLTVIPSLGHGGRWSSDGKFPRICHYWVHVRCNKWIAGVSAEICGPGNEKRYDIPVKLESPEFQLPLYFTPLERLLLTCQHIQLSSLMILELLYTQQSNPNPLTFSWVIQKPYQFQLIN